LLSVVLYIVVPVIVTQFWRRALLGKGGQTALARTLRALAPLSLSALLLTLVLLFGLQGEQIMRQPLVYFNVGLAYWLNRRLGVDRSQQLLLTGRGTAICSLWLPVGRGAFNRRRGAGHAVGRPNRPPLARMV
jgi:predicted Na+-dependent transporter